MATILLKRSSVIPTGTVQLKPGELGVRNTRLYYGPMETSSTTEVNALALPALNINNEFTGINTFKMLSTALNAATASLVIKNSDGAVTMYGMKDGLLYTNVDNAIINNAGNKVLVTKEYVNGVIQGLSIKSPVRVATAAAIVGSLSGNTFIPSLDLTSIDGITLAINDRVLLKNQAGIGGFANGIFIYKGSKELIRAEDANSVSDLVNAFVFVSEGSVNKDTGWVCALNAGQTITDQEWHQFSRAGVITADETTLTLNGTVMGIKNSGVGTSQIANGAVTVDKIAENGVTTEKIANLAVTAAKIADTTITSGKLQDSAVITAKINNKAVTYAKIQDTVAYSILGVGGATAGSVAAITASDGTVLTRRGTSLAFRKINQTEIDPASTITVASMTTTGATNAQGGINIGSGELTWAIDGTGADMKFITPGAENIILRGSLGAKTIAFTDDIPTGTRILTSTTAAATATKAITAEGLVIENGTQIIVRFQNANSAASPKLNINQGGERAIVCDGSVTNIPWAAGNVLLFVNNGTEWVLIQNLTTAQFYGLASRATTATSATKATNISGGAKGSILYQSNADTTTFITAPSTAGTKYLTINKTAAGSDPTFSWADIPSQTIGTGVNSILAFSGTTGALIGKPWTGKTPGGFYNHTTNPDSVSNLIKFDGIMYATQFEGIIDGGTWS